MTYSLNDVQVKAFEKLKNMHSAIIALQTGAGKALLTLHLAKYLHSEGKNTIFFIPKSARAAYIKELETKLDTKDYQLLSSDSIPETLKLGFTFIEFPVLSVYIDTILDLVRNNNVYMFVDEAHILCSSSSLQSECLRRVRKLCLGCYSVTASPFLTDIENLYYLYSSTFPELRIFETWFKFRNRYCIVQDKEIRRPGTRQKKIIKEIIGYKNTEELAKILDVLTIKGARKYNVEYNYEEIELDKEFEGIYEKSARGLLEEDRVKEWGARLHDLQRVVDGQTLKLKTRVCNKILRLMKIVKEIMERNEGTLIYVEYLETADYVNEILSENKSMLGIKNTYIMSGKESEIKKQSIEKKLGRGDVLIITRAASQSRNLQSVNNIIFMNIPYSLGVFLQTSGRICRTDTKYEKQNFYILEVKDTIDTYKTYLFRSHVSILNKLLGEECVGTLSVDDYIQDENVDIKELRNKLLWKKKR